MELLVSGVSLLLPSPSPLPSLLLLLLVLAANGWLSFSECAMFMVCEMRYFQSFTSAPAVWMCRRCFAHTHIITFKCYLNFCLDVFKNSFKISIFPSSQITSHHTHWRMLYLKQCVRAFGCQTFFFRRKYNGIEWISSEIIYRSELVFLCVWILFANDCWYHWWISGGRVNE